MTKEVSIYQFGKDNQRVKVIDGKEWWCVSDACKILDLINVTMAVKGIPSNHLNNIEVVNPNAKGKCKTWRMLFVDEYGINQLIALSRKPQAQPYKEWAFGVVLPSIRKTGSYSVVPNVLEQVMTSLASSQKTLTDTLSVFMASTSKHFEDIEARLAQPKLLPQTTLTKRSQLVMTMRELARLLGMPHKDCWGLLYKTEYYTNGVDLRARARNSGLRIIDVAEQNGYLDELLNICNQMRSTVPK